MTNIVPHELAVGNRFSPSCTAAFLWLREGKEVLFHEELYRKMIVLFEFFNKRRRDLPKYKLKGNRVKMNLDVMYKIQTDDPNRYDAFIVDDVYQFPQSLSIPPPRFIPPDTCDGCFIQERTFFIWETYLD
jgi:hypothetical protein